MMKYFFKKGIQRVVTVAASICLLLTPINVNAQTQSLDALNDDEIVEKIIKLRDDHEVTLETTDLITEQESEQEVQIIVELNEKPVLEQLGGEAIDESSEQVVKNAYHKTKKIQEEFQEQLEDIGIDVEIKYEYQTAYNGVSLKVDKAYIPTIEAMDCVKAVHMVEKHAFDMSKAKKLTNIETVWESVYSSYKGEGMLVAVIDSGIDPTHKDLRLSEGITKKIPDEEALNDIINNLPEESEFKNIDLQWFNEKVPTGYNWADQDSIVWENNVIGTQDHGMHVAGIIGANGDEEADGVKGVAPEVQLISQKVVSNNPTAGYIADDTLMAAINHSVALGVDVINLSTGQPASQKKDMTHPLMIAMKNAQDSGVIIVKSAGNTGHIGGVMDDDLYPFVKNPDIGVADVTYEGNIIVGSLENTTAKVRAFSYDDGASNGLVEYILPDVGRYPDIRYFVQEGNEIPVVYAGFGTEKEFATLIANDIEVEGAITLVKRSPSSFKYKTHDAYKMYYSEKVDNAQKFGAIALLIIDKESSSSLSTPGMGSYDPQIPYVMGTFEDFESMFTSIGKTLPEDDGEAGELGELENIHFEFSSKYYKEIDNATKGELTYTTTWGTTDDLDFYPDVTAPGSQIWSLANDDGYTMKSGTSMSTPHIVGISTLVYQAYKEKYPEMSKVEMIDKVKKSIMNTAKVVEEEEGVPYLTRRQGAGLAQVDLAIETPVVATPKIELKEFQSNGKTFEITLENLSDEEAVYEVPVSKVYTGKRIEEDGYEKYTGESAEIQGASVEAESVKDAVYLDPNSSKSIEFIIDGLPEEPFTEEQPGQFVEGFVEFKSLNGDPNLSIPFMGFYGDWDMPRIIDRSFHQKDSFHGLTGLYGVTSDHKLYKLGFDFDEEEYIEESVAVSNHKYYKRSVQPMLSFLRNAKETEISVYYAEKDGDSFVKGEKIYDISKENFLKKNYSRGIYSTSRMKSFENWKWDGTYYDGASGKRLTAPDGWYLIECKTTGMYEGATWQTERYPVLIESKVPTIYDAVIDEVESDGDVWISFKAEDNFGGTGIAGYHVILNDDFDNPIEIEPSDISNDRCKISKTKFKTNGEYNINIIAFDYAGNGAYLSEDERLIVNQSHNDDNPFNVGQFIRLTDEYPETVYVSENELEVSYEIQSFVKRVTVKVVAENGMISEEIHRDKDELSYTIKSLKEGQNTVYLIPATGSSTNPTELPDKAVVLNVVLDTVPPNIYVTDPSGEEKFGSELIKVKGKAFDLWPLEYFKINGQDVSVDDKQGFETIVTCVEEGEHIIEVMAKDLAGNEVSFDIPIITDFTSPVLTLDSDSDSIESKVVSIGKNRLRLKGSIIDQYSEAALFINNDNIAKMSLEDVREQRPAEFDTTILLDEGKNIILLELFDGLGNVYIKQFVVMRGTQYTLPEITVNDHTVIEEKISSRNPLAVSAASSENIDWTIKIINDDNNVVEEISVIDNMNLQRSWVPNPNIKDGDYQLLLEGSALDGRQIEAISHEFIIQNAPISINNILLTDLNGTEKQSFNEREQIMIQADFTNESEEDLSGVGFFKITSGQGQVIYIGFNDFSIPSGQQRMIKNGFTILPGLPKKDYGVEVFIWQDLESMNILAPKAAKKVFSVK